MDDSTYIFIDGGYLARGYAENIRPWFGSVPEMNLRRAIENIRQEATQRQNSWMLSAEAYVSSLPTIRTFYYDCLDEDQKQNESADAFAARLQEQDKRLREIRDIDDCVIRLGSLRGTKRREQKEVDVLIAVDMMAHAARDNMDTGVLVTGDLDLRPAVEALVQLGISVQIISEEKSTSRQLTWAASSFKKLTFRDFFQWAPENFKQSHPIAREPNYSHRDRGPTLRRGSVNGDACSLHKINEEYLIHFPLFRLDEYPGPSTRTFGHDSLERLELFFQLQYAPIEWEVDAVKG
jgi:uncharacterized LabA/DUF88 family protein